MALEDPKPTSLRLPADLKQRLVELAEADGRSLSNYLLKVLTEHVAAAGKSKWKKR